MIAVNQIHYNTSICYDYFVVDMARFTKRLAKLELFKCFDIETLFHSAD